MAKCADGQHDYEFLEKTNLPEAGTNTYTRGWVFYCKKCLDIQSR